MRGRGWIVDIGSASSALAFANSHFPLHPLHPPFRSAQPGMPAAAVFVAALLATAMPGTTAQVCAPEATTAYDVDGAQVCTCPSGWVGDGDHFCVRAAASAACPVRVACPAANDACPEVTALTDVPTPSPTLTPSETSTRPPTTRPPTAIPTPAPSPAPSRDPSMAPATLRPTGSPSSAPTAQPSRYPSWSPTAPTASPTPCTEQWAPAQILDRTDGGGGGSDRDGYGHAVAMSNVSMG